MIRPACVLHASTAAFVEIPASAIQNILARAKANYDVLFDNDQ